MSAGTERAATGSASASSGTVSCPEPNSDPSPSSTAGSAEAHNPAQAPSDPTSPRRIEWSSLQKMLPFAGAAVLSDGSAVHLFPWLQRQFATLSSQGLVVAKGSKQKINVSVERAEKLLGLLSKKSDIFEWQNNSSP